MTYFAVRILVALSFFLSCTTALAGGDSHATAFDMKGLQLGASPGEIRKAFPTTVCDKSCVGERASFLGSQGRFVAFLRDDKASMIAFSFPSTLSDQDRKRIRGEIERKYGRPTSHLGIEGCNEWAMPNGFVAICLNKEINHIVLSENSRVDVNMRSGN